MKILKTSVLCAVLSFCLHASAQSNALKISEPDYGKPKLFNDLPDQMKLHLTDLESLFTLPVGTFIKTQLTDNFNFQGTVVSKSDEADKTVKSVVLKSVNRQGSTLTLTKTLKADGTF